MIEIPKFKDYHRTDEGKTMKFTNFDKMIDKLRLMFLEKYNVKSLNDLPQKARDNYMKKMESLIGSNVRKLELDVNDI